MQQNNLHQQFTWHTNHCEHAVVCNGISFNVDLTKRKSLFINLSQKRDVLVLHRGDHYRRLVFQSEQAAGCSAHLDTA